MKARDGRMRRGTEFRGNMLFIVLQHSQAEGDWLSLTVQHIREHG